MATEVASMLLAWPFIHNGFYYEGRRLIDGWPYRFWSQSETTTAVLSFDFPTRLFMLICGITPHWI